MRQTERVWVVGAGALGSVLAALLHQSGKAEVFLVGASPHWRQVSQAGLRLEKYGQGEALLPLATRAWEEVPPLGPSDLVLLTGKATDLPRVAERLRPKLDAGTAVFTLQNGLGVRELAGRLLGRPVEAGVALFGARSVEPGQVAFYGPGRLVLSPGPASQTLAELLAGEDFTCEQASDYRQALWYKLAMNCLANPLAGILSLPNQELGKEALNPAKEALLAEVKAVARAEGVEVELSVSEFNQKIKGPNVPSLRTDLDRGRPSEIDFLNGAIVELAAKHGIPAPANQLVTSLIRYMTGQAGAAGSGE